VEECWVMWVWFEAEHCWRLREIIPIAAKASSIFIIDP